MRERLGVRQSSGAIPHGGFREWCGFYCFGVKRRRAAALQDASRKANPHRRRVPPYLTILTGRVFSPHNCFPSSIMKKCTYCGLENPDEAAMCSTCHTEFGTESPPTLDPPFSREYVMSPEEQRFWEMVTFRKILIVIMRILGLWLLFSAALQATLLVPTLITLAQIESVSPMASRYNSEFVLAIVRLFCYVAAGLALLNYTEKLLGWLVKDLVSKPATDTPPPSAAVAPPSSNQT
jgi:hypothetical protein